MRPAPIGPGRPEGGTGEAAATRAKLRRVSHQLEGMFVRQLFEAMRRTAPPEGPGSGEAGGAMFTSMLDDALADQAAQRLERGLGEALYRQLSRRLGVEAAPSSPGPAGPGDRP